VLGILYEKEIEEEKFLAKLDKLEKKRQKKAGKLKASGNESEDGLSDTDLKNRARKTSDAHGPRLGGLSTLVICRSHPFGGWPDLLLIEEDDSEEMPQPKHNVGTPTDEPALNQFLKKPKDSPSAGSSPSPSPNASTANLPPPPTDQLTNTTPVELPSAISAPIPIPIASASSNSLAVGSPDTIDSSTSPGSVDIRSSSSSIPKDSIKKTPKGSRKKLDTEGVMRKSSDDTVTKPSRNTVDDPANWSPNQGDWSPIQGSNNSPTKSSPSEDGTIIGDMSPRTGTGTSPSTGSTRGKSKRDRDLLKKTNSGVGDKILPQHIQHSEDRRKTIGGAEPDHLRNLRSNPTGSSMVSLAPVEDPSALPSQLFRVRDWVIVGNRWTWGIVGTEEGLEDIRGRIKRETNSAQATTCQVKSWSTG